MITSSRGMSQSEIMKALELHLRGRLVRGTGVLIKAEFVSWKEVFCLAKMAISEKLDLEREV